MEFKARHISQPGLCTKQNIDWKRVSPVCKESVGHSLLSKRNLMGLNICYREIVRIMKFDPIFLIRIKNMLDIRLQKILDLYWFLAASLQLHLQNSKNAEYLLIVSVSNCLLIGCLRRGLFAVH